MLSVNKNKIRTFMKLTVPYYLHKAGAGFPSPATDYIEEDIDLNSDNISVFPLATPIIAGPAAITSVIVSVSDIGTNFTNQTAGMLSLVSVLFLTFIIFFIASKFSKIINKKIIGVISRVVAIILVGLSVQYILDGIKTFLA